MAANISKDDVVEFISNMTVLELSEFVKALEQKFGVSAAAPVAMMAAPAAAQAKEEAAEKTEFDVILTASGDKKIQVIKEVRAITSSGSQRGQGPGGRHARQSQGGDFPRRGGKNQEAARRRRRHR